MSKIHVYGDNEVVVDKTTMNRLQGLSDHPYSTNLAASANANQVGKSQS
jgi:hypothetical protein